MQVHCVDKQPALEIIEGHIADESADEGFKGLAALEGRGKQSAEGDVGSSYLKDIPAADQSGPRFHVAEWHSGSPRSSDERPDARSDHQARHQAPFLQRLEDPDMGQAFEAATTEDECKRAVGYHGPIRQKVTRANLTVPAEVVQESCAPVALS